MKPRTILYVFLVILAAAALSACDVERDLKVKNQTVELGEAESVDVELDMGAGELNLEGGAAALMEGTFHYRFERRIPEVEYSTFAKKGKLSIHERRRRGIRFGGGRTKWDIRLNNRVPMVIKIDLGAGASKLDLRDFQVKRLDIDMGVGALTLDLGGERSADLDVKIDGGIGHATIYLPANIGVRAEIDGGLGSIHAPNFKKAGDIFTNEAYGKSAVSIELRVDAGIGSIDLELR
jgi:hypothetical protein